MGPQPFARSPLLASIPDDAQRALVRAGEICSFRRGHIIFERDEPGGEMYAIVSGQVKVYLQSADGGEILVAMRGAGEVLGEMSLLDGQGRSASAAAYDDVKAIRVSRAAFRDWLVDHPGASWPMLEALSRRLREATEQVGEIALLSADARIARRLWHDISTALKRDPAAGDRLPVNQSQLATALGLTRESVNKNLAKMRAANILATHPGEVELLDPEALRLLAG